MALYVISLFSHILQLQAPSEYTINIQHCPVSVLQQASSTKIKMLRRLVLQASTQRCSLFGASSSLSWCRQSSSSSSSQSPNSNFVEHLEDNEPASPTPPSAAISIDRSGLHNPPQHSHEPSSDCELVKHLKSIIKFRGGPISVAEYMEEVLTNPKAGFYINRDVFGAEGDFITSPEVSQMFGEMVGVWAMCLWEQMGQPKNLNLVELGPGRGTLLADLLRGASKFRNFTDSLHIHMVECSPTLKKLQYRNLKCINKNDTDGDAEEHIISRLTGTSVSWHATLEQVPAGTPTIIIAHEFYDALPVHQFQRASRGWCEKMVDVAENSMFQFVLSKQPTPATLYLLKRFKWAENEEIGKLEQVEVCPKAMDLTQEIAKRIGSDGGGALIIDYGLNGIVSDSLQAIRKHGFVNILDNPGTADLSAYVDFAAIRHSAEEASDDVAVHGPMTQSQFLGALGINFRAEALMENCTDEQADSLRTGYWRLVGEGEAPFWEGPAEQAPLGMGTRYLAMAIVNKKQGVPIPFQ
ncbi:protein arginine methyltransferase NDUFAF7, mitochondrial [Capsicum galapagoense]